MKKGIECAGASGVILGKLRYEKKELSARVNQKSFCGNCGMKNMRKYEGDQLWQAVSSRY